MMVITHGCKDSVFLRNVLIIAQYQETFKSILLSRSEWLAFLCRSIISPFLTPFPPLHNEDVKEKNIRVMISEFLILEYPTER